MDGILPDVSLAIIASYSFSAARHYSNIRKILQYRAAGRARPGARGPRFYTYSI